VLTRGSGPARVLPPLRARPATLLAVARVALFTGRAHAQATYSLFPSYRHIDTLLANALGPKGDYGAFNANMHVDGQPSAGATGSAVIIASAPCEGVSIIKGVGYALINGAQAGTYTATYN
jgi:hypothetical protein